MDSKSNVYMDNPGNSMACGLGLKFKTGAIAIRAEYEYFDTDVSGIGFTSAGVSWHFQQCQVGILSNTIRKYNAGR